MHQTRASLSRKIPLSRKGTKYLVRAKDHPSTSVPVLIALRDMLHLARDGREVKQLIHQKKIKINGRLVDDFRQTVKLFSIFEAEKKYRLTLLPTGRLNFEETKDSTRTGKIIGKRLIPGNKIQICLHDGTTFVGKKELRVGDSVVLDMKNKVVQSIPLEKGQSVFIISGKSIGQEGKILSADEKGLSISIGGKNVTLSREHVVAL